MRHMAFLFASLMASAFVAGAVNCFQHAIWVGVVSCMVMAFIAGRDVWHLRPRRERCKCPFQFRIGRSCGDRRVVSRLPYPFDPDKELVLHAETMKFKCTNCGRVSLSISHPSTIERKTDA